jgi:hypothetical protein
MAPENGTDIREIPSLKPFRQYKSPLQGTDYYSTTKVVGNPLHKYSGIHHPSFKLTRERMAPEKYATGMTKPL